MRHALLIALLAWAGCGNVRPCRSGTLLLTLTLDQSTSQADQLHIAVVMPNGTPLADDVTFHPGTLHGTLEVDLPSYPRGQSIGVTVTALRAGVALGSVERQIVLDGTCSAQGLTIAGAGDAGIPDLGDGGAGDGGQPDLFTKQALAMSCSGDDQCLSGHCVDGVCCQTACEGTCEACDLPGELGGCGVVPAGGQPHGTRARCAGNGATCGGTCDGANRTSCAFPGSSVACRPASCANAMVSPAAGCDGAGGCPAAQPVACSQGACNATNTACLGACASDTDCKTSPNIYCQPDGSCKSTRPNGRTCTTGSDCTSTACVDGYCCNSTCTGQCQACDLTGNLGTCTTVTSGNAHGSRASCPGFGSTCGASCTGGSATSCTYSMSQCRVQSCSGSTLTQSASCASGSCPSATTVSCSPYLCNGATDCLTTCTSASQCVSGAVCTAAGACCVPNCANKMCGPDGCGGSCGGCPTNNKCIVGSCVPYCGSQPC